jgi:hypothetical protein
VRAAPNKRKLTSLTVTRLRPDASSYLVWDSYQRGLALQVQPSGYRAFKFIYRHRKRPRWYTIGAADAIALADARRMAAELMLEVLRGKDPAAEKRAEHNASTFAELAQKYIDQDAKKRNRSWKATDAIIRRHVLSVGCIACRRDYPSRRYGADARPGGSTDNGEPDAGVGVGYLLVGGEEGNPFGHSQTSSRNSA